MATSHGKERGGPSWQADSVFVRVWPHSVHVEHAAEEGSLRNDFLVFLAAPLTAMASLAPEDHRNLRDAYATKICAGCDRVLRTRGLFLPRAFYTGGSTCVIARKLSAVRWPPSTNITVLPFTSKISLQVLIYS